MPSPYNGDRRAGKAKEKKKAQGAGTEQTKDHAGGALKCAGRAPAATRKHSAKGTPTKREKCPARDKITKTKSQKHKNGMGKGPKRMTLMAPDEKRRRSRRRPGKKKEKWLGY